MSRAPGYNVIGHVSGSLGLGVLARSIIRLIRNRGMPVAVLDIDPGLGRGGMEREYENLAVVSAAKLPHPINLCVLPPPTLPLVLPELCDLVCDPARLNAALPMWELPVIPRPWRGGLEFFDVLVAGTPFIRYALEFSLSGVLVLGAHCPSRLPGPIAADRARFGLPADKVVFLTAFEPYSDSARKNPEGAVKAFLRVAGRDDRVHLIVKVNMPTEAQEHPSVTRLRELTGGSATVSFLTASHTHEEVLRLYASVDVVVSLHRGEGLGLVPMEAMALGKPVIATAWSGNMAYMDHRSACLVGYRLVPVKGSGGLYERLVKGLHVLWAEPDLDVAADWMQRLADDAALRACFGAAGREAVRRYQTVAAEGSFLDELAILYERRSIVCKGSLERQRQLATIARAHRRELFLHKLTSPEAWRMFARHRLARLSGTREA